MKKLPVAESLPHNEYEAFLKTYSDHNRSMKLEKRKNYTLSHIVQIERNPEENCLNVYYENGDW